jgi:hypothetical protein
MCRSDISLHMSGLLVGCKQVRACLRASARRQHRDRSIGQESCGVDLQFEGSSRYACLRDRVQRLWVYVMACALGKEVRRLANDELRGARSRVYGQAGRQTLGTAYKSLHISSGLSSQSSRIASGFGHAHLFRLSDVGAPLA